MYTHELLVQRGGTMQTQLSMLVWYIADIIIRSFSARCRWIFAHLAFSNDQSLTHFENKNAVQEHTLNTCVWSNITLTNGKIKTSLYQSVVKCHRSKLMVHLYNTTFIELETCLTDCILTISQLSYLDKLQCFH